ncbi:MAG: RNA polymerase sigma factor [Polyangiaceae bacterium]|jgi:RNA polymerase sigma-70 factor, ECF subfamily
MRGAGHPPAVPGEERTEATADDAALLAQLRAGDEGAFRALVRGQHRALLRVAMAFVESQAAAEEIVQDTWLAVIAALDQFEGRSSLRTWIGRILVNRAKTRGVRDRRTVPFSALTPEDEAPTEPERFAANGFWCAPPRPHATTDDAPEALVLRKEARTHIERELEALPPAQRTVVTLRDLEGWSSEEVCNVLEVSETNQRVLLHRGRTRLRAALERYYSGHPGQGKS